jgi:hypothetical protein
MTQECIDNAGRPTKLSFKNTSNILAHLKSIEVSLKLSYDQEYTDTDFLEG